MIVEILLYYILATLVATVFIALYGIATRPHIIKKLVMLTIFSDTVEAIAVYLGYRVYASKPPVVPGGVLENYVFPSSSELEEFGSQAVDPVPQVLIVTAIVIGLSVLLFLVVLSIRVAEKYGTFNLDKIEEKGGVYE